MTALLGPRARVLLVTFNRLLPADQGNARRILQLVRSTRPWASPSTCSLRGGWTRAAAWLAKRFAMVRVLESRGASARATSAG
jgi:hypothetical protein